MTTYKQPLQWTHIRSVAVRMTFVLLTLLFIAGLVTAFFTTISLQKKQPPPLPATLHKQVSPPIIAEIDSNLTIEVDNKSPVSVTTYLFKSDPVQSLSKVEETAVSSQPPLAEVDNFYEADNRKRPLPTETFNQQIVTQNQPTNVQALANIQTLANAQLIIPSINVAQTIMNIPIRNGEWDISELDAGIGHLTTTGTTPGDDLAMTFVGHATVPGAGDGAFANLPHLTHGEQLIYRWNGFDYTYEVTRILLVTPDQVGTLYEENGNMIMMATCSGWNSEAGAYLQRMVTRAELVSITPSPGSLFR